MPIKKDNHKNTLTYSEFIDNIIKSRGQWGITDDECFEGHHIIPRCLGGQGNPSRRDPNIVRLTPQEHYIAHKLLAEENPDNEKLLYAWHMMAFKKSGSQKRDYEISMEESAALKKSCNKLKSRPILCIETGITYESCSAAAKTFNDRNICAAANGKRKKAAGYHWAYTDDAKRIANLQKFKGNAREGKTKSIICIETGRIFDKVIDAADYYDIGRPNISYCLLGRNETAGGYHWAYANDAKKIKSLHKFKNKGKTTLHERQEIKFGHKIICKELNKRFMSAKAAASWINANYDYKISSGNIMYVCRGLRKTTAGFHWEFEKENS